MRFSIYDRVLSELTPHETARPLVRVSAILISDVAENSPRCDTHRLQVTKLGADLVYGVLYFMREIGRLRITSLD